jgi:thiosulfate dehydrogenase
MIARTTLALAALGAAALLIHGSASAGGSSPQHAVPKSTDGDVVVALCDGETSLEVQGVKDPASIDRGKAQEISDQLMKQWLKKNPKATWDPPPVKVAQAAPAASQAAQPAAKQVEAASANATVQAGHTYGAFSARDEAVWKASTEQILREGHRVFHDAKELGGTVAISCDMCHPDASNTHPETYPKFQVQLGRVALLRDMINWCIENPVRGKPIAEDDPRMKAMEAYIYAQRKGVKLEYGKH